MLTEPRPQTLRDLLIGPQAAGAIGAVGSPSNTTEITIDILQASETQKILGQLVYLLVPQDSQQLVVIGQISKVETKNRWHEDITFRGIIKRNGHLPNLSGRADVRTAVIAVQACFGIPASDSPQEEVTESILGISPSTGLTVYRVRDEVLDALLHKYADQIIYLGHVYGTQVKMPFWLKHFGVGPGGAGEAYHIGVFGRSGSGKSGLAAYCLLGYARHTQLGILFVDPQGQFSTNMDLPFDLQGALRRIGRPVHVYRLSTQVRLPTELPLFCRLLRSTRFYRTLGVGSAENIDQAVQELRGKIETVLGRHGVHLDTSPPNLLPEVLQDLLNDTNALQRIYLTPGPRTRLVNTLNAILASPSELANLTAEWQPILDLFMQADSRGNHRTPLATILQEVTGSSAAPVRPIVFLDISGQGTSFADDDEVKALFLNQISRTLRWQGEREFQQGNRLNCLVALDEAHRFARARSAYDASSELGSLSQSFVDAVRTTRKFGLGYMFITQTLASLHPEILQQLRLNAFGFGLTMGSEFGKLQDLVGEDQALALYRSFVDPQSNRQFPFMFTGPASPLSFTGAPLFVQVFTDFAAFEGANAWLAEHTPTPTGSPPPRRQVPL